MEHALNASELKNGEERAYKDTSFRSFFLFVFLFEDQAFFVFLSCFVFSCHEQGSVGQTPVDRDLSDHGDSWQNKGCGDIHTAISSLD